MEGVFHYRVMAREAEDRWKGNQLYLVPDAALPRDAYVIEGSNDKVLTLPAEARLVF